jgi:ATP synthase F1 delta subunit
MILAHKIISKRYACAFLNQYEDLLHDDYYEELKDFSLFLRNNKWLYAYLSISSIDEQIKKDVIDRLHSSITPSENTQNLIALLRRDKRIRLLDCVLEQIIIEHQKRKKIMHFTVTSAHTLSTEDQDRIITHLKELTNNNTLVTFNEDPLLIEGIRIQSSTLLWEHSIAQRLRKFNHSLLRQVHL